MNKNQQLTVTPEIRNVLYAAAQAKGSSLSDAERNVIYASFTPDAPSAPFFPATTAVNLQDILAANVAPLDWIALHPPANTEKLDASHPIRVRKDLRVVYGLQAVLAAKNAGAETVQCAAASIQEEMSA